MAYNYTTIDGDVLDKICYDFYGQVDTVIDKVMDSNRHLANLSAELSEGIVILLPDIEVESSIQLDNVWE